MLRIKGLTKRYPTSDLALKGIDLDVPDGEVMALIGPSGAGKSTVIRCINRLVEPTAGTVTLNDIEITTLGGAELRRARRRMGMIFQEYALVERLTVMENVLSGRLGYVGFWHSWLRKFPQGDVDEAFRLLARVGLDQMADKRADELSGGQRQRVGICRALIQNPDLLLVDEPTASLDPKTFFFQAEDGIRDADVTGVQTCALPISSGTAGCGNFRKATSTRHSGCSPASVSITWPISAPTNYPAVSGSESASAAR